MDTNSSMGCGKALATLGALAAIISLVVALFAWLMPFGPVGPSPFVLHPATPSSAQTETSTDMPTVTPMRTETPTGRPTATATPDGLTLRVSVKRLDNYISDLEVKLTGDKGEWTGITNAEGMVQFSGLSPGQHYVYLGGGYSAYTFGGINLMEQPGQVISFVVPAITTDLLILEPLPETPVTATPYLGWAAYPGAIRYTVYVWRQNEQGNQDIWEVLNTKDTHVEVSRPLESGNSYEWTVYSYYGPNDDTMLAVAGFGPTYKLKLEAKRN